MLLFSSLVGRVDLVGYVRTKLYRALAQASMIRAADGHVPGAGNPYVVTADFDPAEAMRIADQVIPSTCKTRVRALAQLRAALLSYTPRPCPSGPLPMQRAAAAPVPSEYVYCMRVVQGRDDGWQFFKLGRTQDLERRRRQLQTGNHCPLVVVWCKRVPDGAGKERAMHHVLSSARIANSEFFAISRLYDVAAVMDAAWRVVAAKPL